METLGSFEKENPKNLGLESVGLVEESRACDDDGRNTRGRVGVTTRVLKGSDLGLNVGVEGVVELGVLGGGFSKNEEGKIRVRDAKDCGLGDGYVREVVGNSSGVNEKDEIFMVGCDEKLVVNRVREAEVAWATSDGIYELGLKSGDVLVGGNSNLVADLKTDDSFLDKLKEGKGTGGLSFGNGADSVIRFSLQKCGMGELGLLSEEGRKMTVGGSEVKTVSGQVKELLVVLPEIEGTDEIAAGKAHLSLVDEKQNAATGALGAQIAIPRVEDKPILSETMLDKSLSSRENLVNGVSCGKYSGAGCEVMEETAEVDGQSEEVDALESRFSVGDFVWGKMKSYPWWPAQIYDQSDASDYASKYCQKGRFLVVFFGDRTFAWCHPSQLKPFFASFHQMLEQSKSTSFVAAVEEALAEVGRCVKADMVCSCVPQEDKAMLVRPVSVVPGVKEGVRGPQGRIDELYIAKLDPSNFLARLRDAALVVSSMNDVLELAVYRSQVSAFRWVKGYGRLPVQNEDQLVGNPVLDGCKRVHIQTQIEDDGVTSPVTPSVGRSGRNLSRKRSQCFGDRHQRKKRSMAELMQGNMDPELEGDGGYLKEDVIVHGNLSPPLKKQKKKKHVVSSFTMMDNGNENVYASASDHKVSESTVKDEDVEKDGENLSSTGSSRIRKKSKYLSPPYTNIGVKDIDTVTSKASKISRNMDSSNTEINVDPMTTEVSENGELNSKLMGHVIGPVPTLKGNIESSQNKVASSVNEEQKVHQKTTPFREFNASAEIMLSEILSAALNPLYLKGNRSSTAVRGFFSKYRNMKYLSGYDLETYSKHVADFGFIERKSLGVEHSSQRRPPRAEPDSLGKVCTEAAEIGLLGKDFREANGSGSKLIPGNNDGEFLHTVPISMEKSFGSSDKSVFKSSSGGKKRKSLLNEHVLIGKELSETGFGDPKSAPKSGSRGGKRKSLSDQQVSVEKPLNGTDQSVPPSGAVPKKRKYKFHKHGHSEGGRSNSKSGQKTKKRKDQASFPNATNNAGQSIMETLGPIGRGFRFSGVSANPSEANGETPVALLLTFTPGLPLPSKKDLIKIFSKFGNLIESETVVSRRSSCARVVYARSSDAEEAYNSSGKNNAFGPSFVKCQLHHVSRGPEGNNGSQAPSMKQGGTTTPSPSKMAVSGPPLRFIQQNLEIMMSMLSDSAEKETSAEKLSPDVRANLAGEINGLLSKVNTLMGSSS